MDLSQTFIDDRGDMHHIRSYTTKREIVTVVEKIRGVSEYGAYKNPRHCFTYSCGRTHSVQKR